MEFSPFRYQDRYGPHSHRPGLPLPPNFSDHHPKYIPHHHLPPPPLYPPPPAAQPEYPISRTPIPPLPPPLHQYNHQTSQFTFFNDNPNLNPIDGDDRWRFHHRHSPPHKRPKQVDLPPPDLRPSRPSPYRYDPDSPILLDPSIRHNSLWPCKSADEDYIREFGYKSTVESEYAYRGFENDVRRHGSYRSHDDGYDIDSNYGRGFESYVANSTRHSREPGFGLDYRNVSNARQYAPFYESEAEEGEICLPRRRPMGLENHDSANYQEILSADSGRRPYNYDSNRLIAWKKEDRDYIPEKQVQKKSALLRIQLGKSSSRNRNQVLNTSKGSFDRNGIYTFKGRDKNNVVSFKRKFPGGEREGSPVELDVSFRSNALVAKAIVATSCSPVEPEKNLTPRNKKIRKASVSDSPITKSNEGSVKWDDFKLGSDCQSISGNALTQLTEKVLTSDSGSACDIFFQCPSRTDDSGVIPEVEGSSRGTDQTASTGDLVRWIRKKKNATTSVLQSSNNQTNCLNSQTGPSQSDRGAILLEGKSISDASRMVHDIVLHSPSNELRISEIDKSPVALGKYVSYDCSCDPFVPNLKAEGTNSTKIAEINMQNPENGMRSDNLDRSLQDLLSVSNAVNCVVEPQDGSAHEVNDISPHLYFNEVSSIETDLVKTSINGLLCLESNNSSVTSREEEHISHSDSMEKHAPVNNACNFGKSDSELVEKQEKSALCGITFADAGSKLTLNETMELQENDCVNELQNSVPLARIDSIFEFSDIKKRQSQNVTLHVDGSNCDPTTTSSSNRSLSHSESQSLVSNSAFLNDASTQLCSDRANMSPKNNHVERSSKTEMLVDTCYGVDNALVGRNKKKPWNCDMAVSNMFASDVTFSYATSLPVINTTSSCPLKDFISTETEEIGSGVGIPICAVTVLDGDKVMNCNLSTEHSFPTLSETHLEPSVIHSSIMANASTISVSVEGPLNTEKSETSTKDNKIVSISDTVCSTCLPPCMKSNVVYTEDIKFGESLEVYTVGGEIKGEKPCLSSFEAEHKESAALVMTETKQQNRKTDIGSKEGIYAGNGYDMPIFENTENGTPLESETAELNEIRFNMDIECDDDSLKKVNMPTIFSNLSPYTDDNGNSATNPSIELMDSVPESSSNIGSPESLSVISGSHILDSVSSTFQVCNGKDCRDENKIQSKYLSEGASLPLSIRKSSADMKSNAEPGFSAVRNAPISKVPKFLSQDAKGTVHTFNYRSMVPSTINSTLNSAVPGAFQCRSQFSSLRKTTPSTGHIRKPRTWHRVASPSVSLQSVSGAKLNSDLTSQIELSKKCGMVRSSYIRKGNSLVRKASPVPSLYVGSQAPGSSVGLAKPSGIDETKTCKESESIVELPSCLKTEMFGTSLTRPKTPPQSDMSKLVNSSFLKNGDSTDLALNDSSLLDRVTATTHPLKMMRYIDLPEYVTNARSSTEISSTDLSNLENKSLLDEGNSTKSITYVKRNSNQLVVASNNSDVSLQEGEHGQVSKSYYKRGKNQLIRTSLESLNVNSKEQKSSIIPSKTSRKRFSIKGAAKIHKPSKLSLVWSLSDTSVSKKDCSSSCRLKMWSHLFPWKRATGWRNLKQYSAFISDNVPLSTISQKLLISRKRNTIYTRSIHGFSLRISKVLGVDGSSLKWSKSIERNSKKANEEATLAVAAAEKRKREQNGACDVNRRKNRSSSSRKLVHNLKQCPGGRIFRIGSFRYKMDPTRRTLQRISDEEQFSSGQFQSARTYNNSYVPKRLLIGNNEYVRIGNGNQLIRNPKRRTRILANEKVRWSLHTARLRLARKRKYCQFFTRFGKCNKDDGKCPYIHDPSKIAVCTKYLNGSCSNTNCKLTHKVIPERMQDCSYFLQGLCSNENCPYRHVNVNSNASICEGFLRGYCADGNECRRKHTYVCPAFEANGVCHQGSKCKLHHPDNRKKGIKRKTGSGKKNTHGRYFGAKNIGIIDSPAAMPEKHIPEHDVDIFFQDGRYTDYINLDMYDEETVEISDMEHQSISDSDPVELQVADFDDLTKPKAEFQEKVKIKEEEELKQQENPKQQQQTTMKQPRPVEPQLNVKSKNMSREYGGQWLSSTTRHVRIYAAYIDPVTCEFDQTQTDKLTLILDPTDEFLWTPDTCNKVYSYFQELVDHYEGAPLTEYTLRLIGSDIEHYIRKLLFEGEIQYNMNARVLNFSMGHPRVGFSYDGQIPDNQQ